MVFVKLLKSISKAAYEVIKFFQPVMIVILVGNIVPIETWLDKVGLWCILFVGLLSLPYYFFSGDKK